MGVGVVEILALGLSSVSASIIRAESSLGVLSASIKNNTPRVAAKVIAAISNFILQPHTTLQIVRV